jgi:hypothetical protein
MGKKDQYSSPMFRIPADMESYLKIRMEESKILYRNPNNL